MPHAEVYALRGAGADGAEAMFCCLAFPLSFLIHRPIREFVGCLRASVHMYARSCSGGRRSNPLLAVSGIFIYLLFCASSWLGELRGSREGQGRVEKEGQGRIHRQNLVECGILPARDDGAVDAARNSFAARRRPPRRPLQ